MSTLKRGLPEHQFVLMETMKRTRIFTARPPCAWMTIIFFFHFTLSGNTEQSQLCGIEEPLWGQWNAILTKQTAFQNNVQGLKQGTNKTEVLSKGNQGMDVSEGNRSHCEISLDRSLSSSNYSAVLPRWSFLFPSSAETALLWAS